MDKPWWYYHHYWLSEIKVKVSHSVVSLLFNTLSRLVIAFLPRSKYLLISWLQSPSAVILEPPKIKSVTVSIVCPAICHEVMGPDALILVFRMLNFKPAFHSLLSLSSRGSSSSSLSAISVVSFPYLRLLIFLPAILIPACAQNLRLDEICGCHSKPQSAWDQKGVNMDKEESDDLPLCTPTFRNHEKERIHQRGLRSSSFWSLRQTGHYVSL